MSYSITVYEPQADRRDIPNLAHMGQTHRTMARPKTEAEAFAVARELVHYHAEVTIWREVNGVGKPVDGWVPTGLLILDNPRGIRVERNRKSSHDRRRRVDWHLYEYKGSDGEIYRKAFETIRGGDPCVPKFGSHAAINSLQYQWECCDNRGAG